MARLVAVVLNVFVAAATALDEFLGAGRRWRHYRATVEALHGQDQRGRVLGRRRMQRHVRRWERLLGGEGLTPAGSSVVLTRAEARSATGIQVHPPVS